MATKYSKPAIEFQRNLVSGMRFLFDYDSAADIQRDWLRAIYGDGEIVLGDAIKTTANPDDCLYLATDPNGRVFDVRAWWLRRCCKQA